MSGCQLTEKAGIPKHLVGIYPTTRHGIFNAYNNFAVDGSPV
jgi:hypothetical protein